MLSSNNTKSFTCLAYNAIEKKDEIDRWQFVLEISIIVVTFESLDFLKSCQSSYRQSQIFASMYLNTYLFYLSRFLAWALLH